MDPEHNQSENECQDMDQYKSQEPIVHKSDNEGKGTEYNELYV